MSSMPATPYHTTTSLGSEVVPQVNVPPPSRLGVIVLAVLAAILAGIGALLWNAEDSRGAAYVLLGLAVAALAGMIAAAVYRNGRRFSAVMYEKGFTLTRRGRTSSFRFDDIEVLALSERTRLNNGRPIGFDRRLLVRGAGEKESVRHFVGGIDLLGVFTKALLQRTAESASKKNRLIGKGWELDSRGITNPAGTVRFDEISDSNVYDNELRIWRRGEEAPFLSVPLASNNAYVLAGVVNLRVTPSESKREVSAGSMGRHLFDRAGSKIVGILLLLPGLGTFSIPFVWRDVKQPEDMLIALGFTIFGPLALAGALYVFTTRIRFYEHGVAKKSIFGSKEYRFETVEKLSWKATRQYVNGAYAGTTLVAKIWSSEQKRALKFSVTHKGEDDDLDRARETLAVNVASRLDRRIASEGRIPWGGSAWLTTEGIEAKVGVFGKEMRRVSYAQPMNLTMHDGMLKIIVSGDKKPFVSLQAGSDNFFPGLIVFQERVAKTRS